MALLNLSSAVDASPLTDTVTSKTQSENPGGQHRPESVWLWHVNCTVVPVVVPAVRIAIVVA